MTPKERAAMQQALEALEVYGEHAKDCPQYPTYTRPQDYPKCDCGFEEAIAALREALANTRSSTRSTSEYSEQAEQEPVATVVDESEEQTNTMSWILSLPLPVGTKLYAAPVRTKDLTDDEIADIRMSIVAYEPVEWGRVFARAVIAADREKNNPLTKSNTGE